MLRSCHTHTVLFLPSSSLSSLSSVSSASSSLLLFTPSAITASRKLSTVATITTSRFLSPPSFLGRVTTSSFPFSSSCTPLRALTALSFPFSSSSSSAVLSLRSCHHHHHHQQQQQGGGRRFFHGRKTQEESAAMVILWTGIIGFVTAFLTIPTAFFWGQVQAEKLLEWRGRDYLTRRVNARDGVGEYAGILSWTSGIAVSLASYYAVTRKLHLLGNPNQPVDSFAQLARAGGPRVFGTIFALGGCCFLGGWTKAWFERAPFLDAEGKAMLAGLESEKAKGNK